MIYTIDEAKCSESTGLFLSTLHSFYSGYDLPFLSKDENPDSASSPLQNGI